MMTAGAIMIWTIALMCGVIGLGILGGMLLAHVRLRRFKKASGES
jgi:hypothetical protein